MLKQVFKSRHSLLDGASISFHSDCQWRWNGHQGATVDRCTRHHKNVTRNERNDQDRNNELNSGVFS